MKSSPSETSPTQGTSIEASNQVEPNKELIPLSKASQRCCCCLFRNPGERKVLTEQSCCIYVPSTDALFTCHLFCVV
ncbi:hypothetical protein RDI58_007642 [Solanum bulbocastanum]|uniref:Uncharacterized protein n=1 Tax=Solanum bulbocastanum TaxID=147425 RepID=A0AAN8TVK1_SOLBU